MTFKGHVACISMCRELNYKLFSELHVNGGAHYGNLVPSVFEK
jgi:hypothetical protein